MGYFRGDTQGTVIGTRVGLAIAPQEGTRTRAQAQRAFEQARGGIERAQQTVRTAVPKAQMAAQSVAAAAGTVRGCVERMRHHEDGVPYVSVNGSGDGASPN